MQEHIDHIREHLEGIKKKSVEHPDWYFIQGMVSAILILLNTLEKNIEP